MTFEEADNLRRILQASQTWRISKPEKKAVILDMLNAANEIYGKEYVFTWNSKTGIVSFYSADEVKIDDKSGEIYVVYEGKKLILYHADFMEA